VFAHDRFHRPRGFHILRERHAMRDDGRFERHYGRGGGKGVGHLRLDVDQALDRGADGHVVILVVILLRAASISAGDRSGRTLDVLSMVSAATSAPTRVASAIALPDSIANSVPAIMESPAPVMSTCEAGTTGRF